MDLKDTLSLSHPCLVQYVHFEGCGRHRSTTCELAANCKYPTAPKVPQLIAPSFELAQRINEAHQTEEQSTSVPKTFGLFAVVLHCALIYSRTLIVNVVRHQHLGTFWETHL